MKTKRAKIKAKEKEGIVQRAGGWLNARSSRERLLIVGAVVLAVGLGVPALGWRWADDYRTAGQRERAAGEALLLDVRRLTALRADAGPGAAMSGDHTPRGVALAAAAIHGLTVSRAEPDGPSGLRLSLAPASAQAVYRWIETASASGMVVTGVTLVRNDDGDQVAADMVLVSAGTGPMTR